MVKGTKSKKSIARYLAAQQEGQIAAAKLDPLHIKACMLYWAEGGKRNGSISFTNSDINMLKLFRKFLKLYFPNKPITALINYYDTPELPYTAILSYWCKELDLVPDQFYKPTIRNKYYQNINQKYIYGILRLNVNSVDVAQHIKGAITEYIK